MIPLEGCHHQPPSPDASKLIQPRTSTWPFWSLLFCFLNLPRVIWGRPAQALPDFYRDAAIGCNTSQGGSGHPETCGIGVGQCSCGLPQEDSEDLRVLTSQGLRVTQDPVQGLSRDLLKGLVGWGQECELAITLQHGIQP